MAGVACRHRGRPCMRQGEGLAAPCLPWEKPFRFPWKCFPPSLGRAVPASLGALPAFFGKGSSGFLGRHHGGCIPGAGESCLTGVCFMACLPGRAAKSPRHSARAVLARMGEGARQGRESAGEGELHGHAEVLRHGGVTAAGEQGLGALAVIVEREGDHAAHGIVNLRARLDGHVAAGGLA